MTISVLAFSLILIILSGAGVFDPKPAGPEKWALPLNSGSIPPGSRQMTWLEPVITEGRYSLRLTAAYQSGEKDIGYGLVVGDEADYFIVALSPLGYAAVWQGEGGGLPISPTPSSFIFPWRTWPQIKTGDEVNEIWVDVEDNLVTVRVNRELMWSGQVEGIRGKVGLWQESFGQTALVDFQTLRFFSE